MRYGIRPSEDAISVCGGIEAASDAHGRNLAALNQLFDGYRVLSDSRMA